MEGTNLKYMRGRQNTTLAQADLSINLFMSLLALLAILSTIAIATTREGYLFNQVLQTEASTFGPLAKSWSPVLEVYPKIVVRDQSIHALDLQAMAEAFLDPEASEAASNALNSSRLLPGDIDPIGFSILFLLSDDTAFPGNLATRSTPLATLFEDPSAQEVFTAEYSTSRKVDLFFFPNELTRSVEIVDLFHALGIATRIVVLPRDDRFGFVNSGRNFGFERSFK